jgi:hypothetical protein
MARLTLARRIATIVLIFPLYQASGITSEPVARLQFRAAPDVESGLTSPCGKVAV